MEVAVLPSKSAVLLRALVNVLLGLVLLSWPGLTLIILIYAFALNVLIVGIVTLFEPAFDKGSRNAILSILLGLLGIVAGIFLLARPVLTGEIIALLIAFWALLFGIVDIYVGFSASKEKVSGGWVMVLVGILSVIFGIYMLFNPLVGALSLVWVIGVYAVIAGLVLGVFGLFFYPKVKASKK